jgi:hypothetical protein
MVSFSIARRSRRFRFNTGVGLGLLLLFVAYVLALTQLQVSTERTYEELRRSDPDLYLSKIRQTEGFRTYLRQFRELKNYQTPQRLAPPFLIGSWVLYDHALRVDDAYVPPNCLDNVVIEDGHLRTGRPKPADYDVRYRIEGERVLALRDNGPPITIDPVGYGVHVNHIEIVLPGTDKVRYGYMCKEAGWSEGLITALRRPLLPTAKCTDSGSLWEPLSHRENNERTLWLYLRADSAVSNFKVATNVPLQRFLEPL